MADIQTLLWDVGGVILTNSWDREERRRAVEQFHLDRDEFTERHDLIAADLDEGRLTLDQYLDWAVFYRPRDFSREAFREFMLAQSQPKPESLEVLAQLARAGRHRLATLNNESRELNLYRIERFRLRDYFQDFFSSCYLGVRKPRREIYLRALEITQTPAERCIFIDDRKLNLECAALTGMRTVHFQTAQQLQADLRQHGVKN